MAAESSSERLKRVAIVIWICLGSLALIWVFIRIANSVRIIWLPLVFSAGLVFLLNPLVSAFHRLRVPRIVGTFLAFLTLVALLVATGFMLVPVVQQQSADFANELPNIYDTLLVWLEDTGERFNVELVRLRRSRSSRHGFRIRPTRKRFSRSSATSVPSGAT